MRKAIELIVDGYVRLHNRGALEELRMHRRKMAVELKGKTGFDYSKTINQIEDEIVVIEAGLNRLEAGQGVDSHQGSSLQD
ncbi:MAG: hypothetical protein HY852_24550 [Bradyrhizobium sp.]|uniref:hypothetical protein n=1 Tax=Bradyrhizobium sp. TaxID=376 RepID=UPI0025C100BC|nr:hypothetical protein [Bradyrhizobium sp.]MBI5264978.1 hypothetical protein [Bradyrhizobium sp.]